MSILTERCPGCFKKFNCDYYNYSHGNIPYYGVIPLDCWEWMLEHANPHIPDELLK